MPELPEVETTRRGIAPHVEGRRIARVVVRDARLRQPVARGIDKLAAGQSLHTVPRRGKHVLRRASAQGGTTLRDFVDGDGRPGYFQQQLKVYGREGDDCTRCGAAVCCERLGQRATYFCAGCQR